MAISASSIASSSTLNELRTQFNNLVTDVTAIEGGSISYTTLNTTTTNATTLNVKEDGTIVFEGATDDGFETTLTVVDPTADRTITFPNETGTVHTSGGTTTHTAIVVADGGNIGSASDTNAIAIGADGDITLTQDLELQHDGAILSFGADDDTTLTHTDGSGLTLNSTNKLMFNDASQFIQGASATVLDIAATDEIELTATLIDIVGRAEVSGNLSVGGNLDVTGTLDLSDSNFTNVGSLQLDSIAGDGDTDSSITFSGSDVITIATGGSTAATFNASQVTTLSGNLIIPDAGNIGSASDTDAIAIGSDGDITLTQDLELQHDGAILSFGANDEIALTHVHNTGLLLTDSGGSPTLQLHDAGESLSSDGSKLILTSNSVAFNFPNADGTAGQVIKTDGSGTLSFVTASANTPTSADGQALGSASLEWSDLFLADGGTIQFGNDQDTILTHTDGSGLTLNSTNKLMFNDASQFIQGASATVLDIAATDEIELTATLIEVVGNATVSGTLGVTGIATFTDDIIIGDGKTIGSASDVDAITIGSDGDITLTQDLELQHDGAILSFGANDEIALTHVHNTGLLLTDSGGTPTLQLHDANESVSSDGSNLFLTSGGTAYSLTATDGSNGHFLKTDGNGALTFAAASVSDLACDNLSVGDAEVVISTSSGNITIDATANDSDIIFKGTDGTADTTFLTIDGSDAGKLLPNNGMDLNGKELILDADADTSITADTDDTIDIRIAGADDFQFSANNFNVLSGSTLTVDSGATITNSGTANGFGVSVGKVITLAMIFGN